MIDFDKDILQDIVKFEEGELTGGERDALGKKLENDTKHQRHLTYYHLIKRVISASADQEMKGFLHSLHGTEASPEAKAMVNQVLRQDKRRFWFRRLGVIGLAIVLVGLGAYLFRSYFISNQPEVVSSPKTKPPIAVGPIEEDRPVGTPGQGQVKEILQRKVTKIGDAPPVETAEQVDIYLIAQEMTGIGWRLVDDRLEIFATTPERLMEASVTWLKLESNDRNLEYLKINEAIYEIFPSDSLEWLGAHKDETLLEFFEQ